MRYLQGFGNQFVSECLPEVIVPGHNSPQCVPYGLYAEQLSGSAFAMPRAQNFRSWLYRILPSVCHSEFKPFKQATFNTINLHEKPLAPTQLRWQPLPLPTEKIDFIDGVFSLAGLGHSEALQGGAVHLYACNQAMTDRFFYNADGEMLFVPQQGSLLLKTEMGELLVAPKEIAVVPRGVKFQVVVHEAARGYVAENYGTPFRLPDLGMMGANALANPRDFLYPVAKYEDKGGQFQLISKYQGRLWQAQMTHSPLDVVAWYGNYAPYKYDLRLFNVIGSVSFDHPDPSIFTVLHSPSETPGFSNLDFVIFPERWMVAENTFRPPYYHRNLMSEYMGLIEGCYDAKEEGFVPGGSSLHNRMSAHGPDAQAYEKAIRVDLKPEYYRGTLAFMLESRYAWQPTDQALTASFLQKAYLACWQGLKKNFDPMKK